MIVCAPSVLLGLLCAACHPWFGDGIVISRRIKLGLRNAKSRQQAKWEYVTKFGFDVGQSTYAFRIKLLAPKPPLPLLPIDEFVFETHMDEEWFQLEHTPDVCERKKLSRRTFNVGLPEVTSIKAYNTGKGSKDWEWSQWVNGTIGQKIRPHLWFFIISECSGQLENSTATLQVEFRAQQEDGSHFSIEQKWTPFANLWTLFGGTVFLLVFWYKAAKFDGNGDGIHPTVLTLGAAIGVLYFGQLLHTAHLQVFRLNGIGWKAFEILSEVLFMVSQVVQSTLLILIACGYTLTRTKLGSLEYVIPICMMVAMVHILIVVLDKAQGDAAHQFTEHEGFKGWLLVIVRLCLYAWFQYAARGTAAEGGKKVQHFLRRFTWVATMYFLSYPVMFFFVGICAEYYQRPILEGSQMAAQLASNLWLASLFLTKSGYYEASSLGSSPLPSGGSPTFHKDD